MAVAIQQIETRETKQTTKQPMTRRFAARRQVTGWERSEGKPRSHAGAREERDAAELKARLDETLAAAVESADPIAWLAAHATTWPLLSPERVRALFVQLRCGTQAQAGAARERLILSNLRLVMVMAGRMQHTTRVELADLTQEGIIGLMHAIEKFDVALGYRFSTYATWWIAQYMIRAGAQQGHAIRLPQYLYDARKRALRVRAQYASEHGGANPTLEVWAEACGMAPEDLALTVAALAPVFSLDAPVRSEREGTWRVGANEDERAGAELLADPTAEEALEAVDDAVDTSAAATWLVEIARYALRHDTRGERRLALFVAHFRDGVTLEALGKRYGVTREAIRQDIVRAQTLITAAIAETRQAETGEAGDGAERAEVAPLLEELAAATAQRRRDAQRFVGGLTDLTVAQQRSLERMR